MVETPESSNPWNRFSKIAVGTLGALLVGAVGSGLWERVFAPLFDRGIKTLNHLSVALATRYLDHLYSHIGFGLHEHIPAQVVVMLDMLVVLASIGAIVIIVRPSLLGRVMLAPAVAVHRRRGFMFWLLLVMASFNAITYSESLVALANQQAAITWIERSLEIVRPCISEAEHLEIRSEYRSVETARAFFALRSQIVTIGAKCQKTLPSGSPLGWANAR